MKNEFNCIQIVFDYKIHKNLIYDPKDLNSLIIPEMLLCVAQEFIENIS